MYMLQIKEPGDSEWANIYPDRRSKTLKEARIFLRSKMIFIVTMSIFDPNSVYRIISTAI